MRKIPKVARWGTLVVALLLIGLVISLLFPRTFLFKSDSGPHPTDAQYQALLGKFSDKFLNDFAAHWFPSSSLAPTELARMLRNLRNMAEPSAAILAISQENPYKWEDPWAWERQEVRQVDAAIARHKIDQQIVKGYRPTIDKPPFDQFVNQRLLSLSKEQLDTWLTNAILLATREPTYNLATVADPALHGGDMTYHGGSVIDGTANVYLIFWIDASFQPASPKYMSLIEQFVQDIGQSPLYANLSQYHDSSGRYPTSARLAGTYLDTQPFPSDIVAARKNPHVNSNVMDTLTLQAWNQEILAVAAKQSWDTQNYHNIFILLPTMSWDCGYHTNLNTGSPWIYVSYPYFNGQEQCVVVPQSPNHDHVADIATGIVSHEMMEAASDPYVDGWYGGDISNTDGGEMADKCSLPLPTIDQKTNGNVTWNGHTYVIQEEYDNVQHGCVLAGP